MNHMNNRYGTLASWVYDLDKPVGRSFGDVEFYCNRLQKSKGPILEPGVGTGRILIPLLEAGLAIEGFDASENMLNYCRRQCRARGLDARLQLQRFEDFAYEQKFEAIIVPVGSFQLITDSVSARAVLQRFHDHLLPNGRLILDLDPISDFFSSDVRIRSWQSEDGDVLTLTDNRIETDFIAQTTVSHLRYEHWRDGRLIDTELEFFSLRWWGVIEFELALHEAGFTNIVISGDYKHGRPPQKNDQMISFEALRSPAQTL
jgi:SAM-dependent methyltransferase